MTKLIKKLPEFFEDDAGAFSATRLAFLLWIFIVAGMWIYACVEARKMVPIESSVVYLVGVLMTGKVVQSFSENK